MENKEFIPWCPVWEITSKCGLKCIHCGSMADNKRPDELTTKEAFKLCEDLSEIGAKGIALMGGEPLLRKDWFEISKKIKDLGMALSIVTSGYVNIKEILPKLIKLEVDSVTVGFDGVEKTHNHIRGKSDSFEKAVLFIDKCNEAGLDPCPITTFHKINFKEFHKIKDLILNKNLDWHIQTAFPIGRFPRELLLSQREHYTLGLIIAQEQKKYSSKKIIAAHTMGFFSSFIPNLTPYQDWRGCYAGKNAMGIKSNGDINGCDPLPDKYIEMNVRNKSIIDHWKNPDSFKYNRIFNENELGGFCKKCKYRLICKGGCLTRSSSITGKKRNDIYCFYRIEQELFGKNAKSEVEKIKKEYNIQI